MKFILKLSLLLVAILNSKICDTKESLAPIAIQRFVEGFFIKNSVKFEVIYNSKEFGLVDKSLKLITGLTASRVTQVEPVEKNLYKLHHSAILIFDTFENYLKFEDRIFLSNENGPQPNDLFIVCANLSTEKVEKNLPDDKLQIRRYLIEDKEDITLKATTLFTPQACHKQQLVEINQFSRTKLQWTNTKFSTAKIDNFYECQLNILYKKLLLFANEIYWKYDQNDRVSGVTGKGYLFALALDFERTFNFTQNSYFHNYETQEIHLMITAKGMNNEEFANRSSKAPAVRYDWTPSLTPIDHEDFHQYMLSAPIQSESSCIVVPPGAVYTPAEKLLLPFDGTIWMLIILVFAVAFIVAAGLKLIKSYSLYAFISGENVASPGLNIYAILMGIGQLKLPFRNVARMMLMNFILFCLIMRTAYQGKYYEFLTTDPHKKPIRTIDELVSSKFPLYVELFNDGSVNDRFQDPEFVERLKVIYVNNTEMQIVLFEEIQNSSFAGSLMNLCSLFQYQTFSRNDDERLTFHYVDTNIISYNTAIPFELNSCLYPSFNELITRYIENGILQAYQNLAMYDWLIKKPPSDDRIVLKLDHLSVGFQVWLSMLLLPITAFIGELCFARLQSLWFRCRKTMSGYEFNE